MNREKTIETTYGPITLRRPTERELLAKLQKRMLVELGRYPVDAFDDGDEEILDCVTAPERARVEELLEDAPRLMENLEAVFDELAGGAVTIDPGDLAQVPEELRNQHGRRLVVVQHAGTVYALTTLSRVEFKLTRRQSNYMAAVAALGRGHLVHGTIDADEHPSLAVQLGTHLLARAGQKVEADAGKSPSSSGLNQPPRS